MWKKTVCLLMRFSNGTKPPVTADDGYLLSRLLDGIYESAKTGNQLDFRK